MNHFIRNFILRLTYPFSKKLFRNYRSKKQIKEKFFIKTHIKMSYTKNSDKE